MSRWVDNEWVYDCGQCLDEPAGWIALECGGTHCERREAHLPHPFAVRCPHWLREHADAIRLHAEQAMQKGQNPSRTFAALSDLMAGKYLWKDAVTINAAKARQDERRSA